MNEEIDNKSIGRNTYAIPAETDISLNPSPVEGKLDSAMKQQMNDTLVQDIQLAREMRPQTGDPTGNTPMGPSAVGSEKPVFNGTLHEAMIGGKKGNTRDFRKG
jgi:hypothetical protein